MWQLLHIAGALCLYILFLTSSFMSQKEARSATNEAGVMTFVCDFDNCTFEANSASSFKRHKVSHSAPSHCDFPGCFYETVHISNLKRHSSTHSQAEKEVLLILPVSPESTHFFYSSLRVQRYSLEIN